ncbi:MAG: SIS domain-containing protein [Patescibacteria group bacterium]
MQDPRDIIRGVLQTSIALRQDMLSGSIDAIAKVADLLVATLQRGGTIYTIGNGGSAADAQHFAAELVGRFYKLERKAIPAVALSTNTSTLTALGNDYGYDIVFSRQLEAFCKPQDALVGISTSGNAVSVLKGFQVALERRATTVFLTGHTGGSIGRELMNLSATLHIPHYNTGRIQEAHITVIHILCQLIENALFETM